MSTNATEYSDYLSALQEYSDYLSALQLLYLSVMDGAGLTTPQIQQYMLTHWPTYVQQYCAGVQQYCATCRHDAVHRATCRRGADHHIQLMEKFIAIFYTPPASKEATLRKVFAKHGKTYIHDALGAYLYWRKERPDSYKANRWTAMNDFITATKTIW